MVVDGDAATLISRCVSCVPPLEQGIRFRTQERHDVGVGLKSCGANEASAIRTLVSVALTPLHKLGYNDYGDTLRTEGYKPPLGKKSCLRLGLSRA